MVLPKQVVLARREVQAGRASGAIAVGHRSPTFAAADGSVGPPARPMSGPVVPVNPERMHYLMGLTHQLGVLVGVDEADLLHPRDEPVQIG